MDILEQTKPNKNKWISFLADGILSGLMLGIGGMVSLSSENRFLGAFLFSLGLFCIVQFKYGLFTGKVGYIVNRDLPYVAETAVTLVGNALGTLIAALLLRQVRFFTSTVSTMDVTISDRVQATVSGKIHDNPLSIFILAVFCGILMFTAVEGSRKCKEEKNFADILDFHVKFERIHPFQDGNGRVGRLIMFKESLKYNIVPFIIEDNLKMFYYRGLKEWDNEKGYLTDTCLTAQDKYKAYLDYFRIAY